MSAALALQQPVLAVPDFTPEYTVFIDFESYWSPDFTLTKLGTERYVRSDLFETIGVSVDDGDECVWMEHEGFKAWAATVPWEKCAVGAHNTAFDGLILSYHYGIEPGFYIDTLSMARALHGSGHISLEKLMPKYGLGEKGHEVLQAKGKRRKDFTQAEWLQYGVYSMNDCRGCKGLWYAMAEQIPESELHLIDMTMRAFCQPQFVLDEPLLTQYLIDERKRKQEMLDNLSDTPRELRSVLMSNDKFAALLQTLGIEPPRKISIPKTVTARKENPNAPPVETWAFAKSDPGMQEMLEHQDDQIRWLAEARVATKSTINETRTERFLGMGKNGRAMPVFLRYYGAHTGRFSGGDGTNWQNLERTDKRNPSKGALRRAVRAPDGFSVVVADSSQIEARVGAWAAGQNDLLQAFSDKRDIYDELGTVIYQRPINRKRVAADEIPGHVSKCAALGLSFSMGWYTFGATLLRGMLGGPPTQFKEEDAEKLGVDVSKFVGDGKWAERKLRRIEKMPARITVAERIVHCAVANKIVQAYREKNDAIVDFWKTMDDVIETMHKAAEGEQFSFGPGECFVAERHAIVLPNGMKLLYPGLELRQQEDYEDEDGNLVEGRSYYSYLGQHNKRSKLYGGLATENLVQATARVIVMDQLLHMKAAYGLRPATSTHDELVYVVPEQHAPQVHRLLLETMKTAPSWAQGLPLAAEGGYAKSYGEAK